MCFFIEAFKEGVKKTSSTALRRRAAAAAIAAAEDETTRGERARPPRPRQEEEEEGGDEELEVEEEVHSVSSSLLHPRHPLQQGEDQGGPGERGARSGGRDRSASPCPWLEEISLSYNYVGTTTFSNFAIHTSLPV